MDGFINAMLNFLLVSIPEETLWVIATLILLKRFDLLDIHRWKENIKWISIPVLLSSLSIAITRYVIIAPRIIITLLAIFSIFIGIVIIFQNRNIFKEKIHYIKIFLLVLISFSFLIVLTEFLYAPILLAYLKKSILEINHTWSMNFLMSIPARVIQLFMILTILAIQNKKTYLNLIQSIFSDKKITFSVLSFVSILIIFWILLIDVFGSYNIISQFNLNQQILLNILLLGVPSILLILMVYLIILFVEKINQLQQSHQNILNAFDDDINKY